MNETEDKSVAIKIAPTNQFAYYEYASKTWVYKVVSFFNTDDRHLIRSRLIDPAWAAEVVATRNGKNRGEKTKYSPTI